MKIQKIPVFQNQGKLRLDVFIFVHVSSITREIVQSLIKNGFVKVDNVVIKKPSSNIQGKKEVEIVFPFRQDLEIIPQPEIPIDILFEDKDMVVLNKPAGLVVHPAPGNWDGTLLNALFGKQIKEEHFKEKTMRVGLIHRLDKDTSGVMVIAKNEQAKSFLSQQFKDRKVKKTYLAILHGILKPREGTIDAPIGRDPRDRKKMAIVSLNKGGKEAVTNYKVISYHTDKYTLVEAYPKTGRTHQIRIHFSSIGFPLLGDKTYSNRSNDLNINRQALHAFRLEFNDLSGKQMKFTADPPEEIFSVFSKTLKN